MTMTNERFKRSQKLLLFGLVIILTVGLVFEASAKEKGNKKELILQVNKVTLKKLPLKQGKPMLHITAFGEVSSTGWTEPKLVLVKSQCPKSVKCFEFRANPPGGISNPVITPITADYTLHEWEHIKKIKIIAKTNSTTVPTEREAAETVAKKKKAIALTLSLKEDGAVEVVENELAEASQPASRGVGKTSVAYWRYTGTGGITLERLDAYINITTPQKIQVTTSKNGRIHIYGIYFYNISKQYQGPTLPQEGGSIDLSEGYWKMYLLGTTWGGKCYFYATANYL